MRNKKFVFNCIAVFLSLIICLIAIYSFSCRKITLIFGLIYASLTCITFLIAYYYYSVQKITLVGLFTALLIVNGFFCSILFIPFTVPDEQFHFGQAYLFSNWILSIPNSDSSLVMRLDDYALLSSNIFSISSDAYADFINRASLISSNNDLTLTQYNVELDINSDPPQLRILPALGITLGRLLGLGAIPTFYLGRLFNFTFFVMCSYWSVRIIPYGKQILICICLLPITLHIASSYSYDATILGLSFLLIAQSTKIFCTNTKFSKTDLFIIVAICVLITPCKIIYSLILIPFLFIPSNKFRSKKQSIIFKILIICLASAYIAITSIARFDFFNATPDLSPNPDTRGSQEGTFYKLENITSDPLGFVEIILNTINEKSSSYITQLLGGSLGWFQSNIQAPLLFVLSYFLILTSTLIKQPYEKRYIPTKIRVLYFVVFCAISFLIMLSMYLGWTFNSENVINGIQGRYFLPVLPILLLALKPRLIYSRINISIILIIIISFVNIMYLDWILSMAIA